MADITLCLKRECPLAGLCKRKIAQPDRRLQSYHVFEFTLEGKHVSCEFFLPVPGEEKRG